jgi:hypothetical protein
MRFGEAQRETTTTLLVVAVVAAVALSGCASAPKRNPLPVELYGTASVPGVEHARYFADAPPPFENAWLAQSQEELESRFSASFGKPHSYLAISGGGARGAFGAGLLAGWTAKGDRPEFQMVTGISTGALTAPWAYLGSDYDDVLEEMYTAYSTKDLLKPRSKLSVLTNDALMNTEGLQALLARYLDEDALEAIAAEGRRGRSLIIATTNLDAQRPVLWRIHTIAMSGQPGALDLIRQIIIASASIPGAFPPVAIEVEADGQRFDELHVDGGATSQVVLYPPDLDWRRVLEKLQVPAPPDVYVIRNSRLDAEGAAVRRRVFPIAGRTIGSLIRTQGIGDLFRIYTLAARDGLNFNLAFIPEDFDERPKEQFDPAWMRKLFDVGFEMGKTGYEWSKVPLDSYE